MKDHREIVVTRREFAELLPLARDTEPFAPGQVAGTTVASLISAGTELASAYQGEAFPARPGYAAVFRIEEVGEGVQGLHPGDLALAMGGHRSRQVHPAEAVWPLPQGLPATDATFARLMGVSMTTLTTSEARPPDRVVVTGLGPVGHLAAQIFQSCGFRVLACDPDARRRALAARGGIGRVTGEPPLEDPEWVGQTALVLECSGHERAVLDGCRLVRQGGEVVLIGVPWRKGTDLSAHELLRTVFHRYAVVRSGWEWELPRHDTPFRSGSTDANIRAALAWLRDGRVRVAGLYSVYRPEDCQAAYQALLNAKEEGLAIVFDWSRI